MSFKRTMNFLMAALLILSFVLLGSAVRNCKTCDPSVANCGRLIDQECQAQASGSCATIVSASGAVTRRGCDAISKESCSSIVNGQTECYCKTDYCNGNGRQKSSRTLLLMAVVVVVLVAKQQQHRIF